MKKWKTKNQSNHKSFGIRVWNFLESLWDLVNHSSAMTFDDSKGVWKICPCCGGTSVEKDIVNYVKII